MKYATLNNGVKMPMAGIGTFLLEPDDAVDKTLERLDTDYIDLLLIHQPVRN